MKKQMNLKKVPLNKLFKLKIVKIISEDFDLNKNFKGKKCLNDFDKTNYFRIESVFLDELRIYTEGNKIYLKYGIIKDQVVGEIHYEKKLSNKIIVDFKQYGKVEIIFKTKR